MDRETHRVQSRINFPKEKTTLKSLKTLKTLSVESHAVPQSHIAVRTVGVSHIDMRLHGYNPALPLPAQPPLRGLPQRLLLHGMHSCAIIRRRHKSRRPLQVQAQPLHRNRPLRHRTTGSVRRCARRERLHTAGIGRYGTHLRLRRKPAFRAAQNTAAAISGEGSPLAPRTSRIGITESLRTNTQFARNKSVLHKIKSHCEVLHSETTPIADKRTCRTVAIYRCQKNIDDTGLVILSAAKDLNPKSIKPDSSLRSE